ncbi:MAG: sigma-70 family RNA polymerase sigma factor [Rhodocyclaceae bacterium]|nr:sigma-70 family RNA polymerase sigma factor [Rhodocyclaceae bacterium]
MFDKQQLLDEIPRLRRYARALCGDVSRADDLVQDTLERALVKSDLWRGGKLRPWLFTLMHHIFVNQWKQGQRIEYRTDEDLPDTLVRSDQQDGLDLRDLERTLGKLSPDHREILLLVGLEELSYEECASVVGIPIGTVMSRLARGRDRLRRLLAEAEPEKRLKLVK